MVGGLLHAAHLGLDRELTAEDCELLEDNKTGSAIFLEASK